MAYDLFKHTTKNAYAHPPEWRVNEFLVRLPARRGGRMGTAVPVGSFGIILFFPPLMILIEDGADGFRQLIIVLSIIALGAALLYFAARAMFQYVCLIGDVDGLMIRSVPLPPRTAQFIPTSAIRAIVARQRAVTPLQRFLSPRAVDPTFQPWTVDLELDGGDTMVIPVHLRPEEAQSLSSDLSAALAESRRRRAERGGFRG